MRPDSQMLPPRLTQIPLFIHVGAAFSPHFPLVRSMTSGFVYIKFNLQPSPEGFLTGDAQIWQPLSLPINKRSHPIFARSLTYSPLTKCAVLNDPVNPSESRVFGSPLVLRSFCHHLAASVSCRRETGAPDAKEK